MSAIGSATAPPSGSMWWDAAEEHENPCENEQQAEATDPAR